MRIKFLLLALSLIGTASLEAQETRKITLAEAVNLALNNSDASKISEVKVSAAENQLNITKNLQYPDVDISGQYRYLTGADVRLKTRTTDSTGGAQTAQPNVNSVLLGQVNISMPIFSGFKLKNTIKAGENLYKASQFNARNDKEQIALQTIQEYLNLYKATKTISLIQENLKSAQQRVTDFSNMEENGLLARNDLLKAKLQQSTIEISLDEAKKNKHILNYTLAVTLKLPENTVIETEDSNFGETVEVYSQTTARNDLQALRFQEEAAKDEIKVAKSNYYPSLALVGGYLALDLHNALTVTNAMNIGVGVSYNLSNLFKTKSTIKLAKSKVLELEYSVEMASDKIKVQVENAKQEYELSKKKFQVYTQSEEQAIENYRIVKDKYDNGLMNTNDLLEADVQQLQAKIDLTYAKANITQKYYELLTSKGTLTDQFTKQ